MLLLLLLSLKTHRSPMWTRPRRKVEIVELRKDDEDNKQLVPDEYDVLSKYVQSHNMVVNILWLWY